MSDMSNNPFDLAAVLHRINVAELKKMARAWGGEWNMRKDECIAYLTRAMQSPEQVRRVLDQCTPFE
jgi:hypothetical protein